MGARDRWIFLLLFTGFSTVLFLVTVIIAQLEAFVPQRKLRARVLESKGDLQHPHRDEPTAA